MNRRRIAVLLVIGLVAAGAVPAAATVRQPPRETALVGVRQVATGYATTCALLTDQTVRCWGANATGEAGDDTGTSPRLFPVTVRDPASSGPLTGVTQIAVGSAHACGVLGSGQVRCWGLNDHGQLGDDSTTTRFRATVVTNPGHTGPLTGVRHVVAGYQHSCALLRTGGVLCWGSNAEGQLGIGPTIGGDWDRPVPVTNTAATGPLASVTQITAGTQHTCARLRSGEARCWGLRLSGQTGNGTVGGSAAVPVPVLNATASGRLTGVAEVDAGDQFSCARLTSGGVRCWGSNFYGQRGEGTSADDLTGLPVVVQNPEGDDDLTGAAQLSVGAIHACVRLTSGQARCWGRSARGELGANILGGSSNLPVAVRNLADTGPLRNITALEAGSARTCAVLRNQQLRCWGSGASGALGTGSTTDRALPQVVRLA